MRRTTAVRRVEELLGVAVVSSAPVSGGDVATVTKLRVSDGSTVLVKTMTSPPAGMFAREAAGLRWLAEPTGGVEVPDVLAVAQEAVGPAALNEALSRFDPKFLSGATRTSIKENPQLIADVRSRIEQGAAS